MMRKQEHGGALFYVFMVVGLIGILTFAITRGTKENYAIQNASKVAEELYIQANMVKASIVQCTMEWVEGGGDLNKDGTVDSTDNENIPYPLEPDSALNDNAPAGCSKNSNAAGCIKVASDKKVVNLACIGAPLGHANMFTGASNKGYFLPPAPVGFNDWTYHNNTDGVYLQIIAKDENATAEHTINRMLEKYGRCQANINYNNCGTNCFVTWIKRNSCNE